MTEAELRAIRERHAEVVAWEQAEPPIDPPRNMTWPDCHEDRGSLLAALAAEQQRADALAEALRNLADGGDCTTVGDSDCGQYGCIGCYDHDGTVDHPHAADCRWVTANAALAAHRAARGGE